METLFKQRMENIGNETEFQMTYSMTAYSYKYF